MPKRKMLVLGGGGFLGSYAVESLVNLGHPVTVFDRTGLDTTNLAPFLDKINLIGGDLSNQANIDEALQGIDTVFHFASTTIPKTATDDPLFDLESNVGGIIKLLKAARKHHVRKIIYSSSGGGIYGIPEHLPIREDHPTRPISAHAVSKLAIERYLSLYQHLYGLDYVVLRLSNPYGPRQNLVNPQGAITHFLSALHSGKSIEIWGDGSVVRDYFYVRDLLSLFPKLLSDDIKNDTFNISHGEGHSLNQIVKKISHILSIKPRIRFKTARKIDVPVNVLCTKKTKRVLGWKASTDLDTGIAETWGWIQGSR